MTAMFDTHAAITGGVATKADITELRYEMNSGIAEVR